MTELQEIAYNTINKADTMRLQKWKSTKAIYADLLETEKEFMEKSKIYDLVVEIANIMFIEQKT